VAVIWTRFGGGSAQHAQTLSSLSKSAACMYIRCTSAACVWAAPLGFRIALHKRLDWASEILNFCHARLVESCGMIVFVVSKHHGGPRRGAAEHFMHALNVLHVG
jgi:hypothetical protein